MALCGFVRSHLLQLKMVTRIGSHPIKCFFEFPWFHTGNMIDRYCNVLPPNELHSGLKHSKVQNIYKKSYPSRVQRYGTKNSCLWLALMSAHVSKIFTW